MKYEVIRYFTDAQDGEHAYHEGDIYPRDGLNPSEQRIKDLMSGNNFQKVALIQMLKEKSGKKAGLPAAEEKKEEPLEVKWTADDIQRMPFMKLKSIAKKNGIETENKSAFEIKKEMIEKLVEE